jgi:hypothetical protein
MMSTDFRALPPGYIDPEHTGADRHLLQVFYRACQSEGGTADEIHLRGIRAVLADAALAQPEPEVAGLSDDAIEADFRSWYNERYHHHYFGAIPLVECIEWTRYALTRYGTRPQPVPVAERPWEREGWCDAEGRCWWWHAATDDTNPGWIPATYADIELVGVEFFDSSLPHHALPVPTP